MDKEVDRRKPGKRAHGKAVGAAVMDGKLLLKVRQRKERVERIKAFLAFPVAALYFAIMPGRVRANELMADSQVGSGFLIKGGDVSITVGKTIRASVKASRIRGAPEKGAKKRPREQVNLRGKQQSVRDG